MCFCYSCGMKARSYACANFFEPRVSGRSLIKVGGMGLWGLTLRRILRPEATGGAVKGRLGKGRSVNFFETRVSRRSLIKVGGMGMLGLTLPKILRAEATGGAVKSPVAKAKSVIFLYQFGGPSHVDMFDRKPDAPEGIRGPLDAIPS